MRARTGARLLLMLTLVSACRADVAPEPDDTGPTVTTPPLGDPDAGWDALRYGDFVGSGVPADVWFDLVGESPSNLLERDGRSAGLPSSFNLFEAPSGAEVVGGITCFGCHAGWIDGTFVPGLGNPRADFVGADDASMFELLGTIVEARYGDDSPEALAYDQFSRGFSAVSAASTGPFVGANPAFSLERAAAAHRDPATLAWEDAPRYDVPAEPLWCDTPPLWNADRKQHLYWTGFGTGRIDRMLMQISVVAVADADQAEEILQQFPDIRAWMAALQPPPFPEPVDPALADAGAQVFATACASCHGTYGEGGTYPERFVPLDEIGTDPVYALGFVDSDFVDWAASSWYGEGAPPPGDVAGYVAPPLDGIWATAPYLHNGSVPDLASLLDPSQRPDRWRRDPDDSTLDHVRLGWPYTVPEPGSATDDAYVYDTSVSGAGNGGHGYGAALTEDERAQVLAYLATL
ncbi:MAG: c-type cytochrome [Myxococcota bacterium]